MGITELGDEKSEVGSEDPAQGKGGLGSLLGCFQSRMPKDSYAASE
jgi:hypothetical protein